MKRRGKAALCLGMAGVMAAGTMLSGCGKEEANGKVKIEVVQYKPEAVDVFEELEKKFNETHDNIELVIDSPNDAMTILKTRFIREDYPDIIGIGGDVNYSNFLDSDMLMDISDFDGLADVKEAYLQNDKELEYVPMDGTYALPYMANAAGVLYNRDMFEEHGWTIPTTWDEFTALCEKIEAEGIKTVIITDEYAGRDGKSQSLADADVAADAVVTGGNANEVVILPKLDKVIGTLDYVTKIAGASEDTLREDGSLEVELQVITGATNETGFNKLSAR